MEMTITQEQKFRQKVNILSLLCAWLVVLLHSYSFNGGARDTAAYHLEFFISRNIAQASVPVFFAMSGFLFYRNLRLKDLPRKWKSRLFSLVIPYLVWNLVYMIAFWALSRLPFINTESFDLTWETLRESLLFYKYNDGFWFVFNLILLTYLCPVLWLALKWKWPAVCFMALAVWLYSRDVKFLWLMETRALIYYSFGAFLALHYQQKVVSANRFHWSGAVAFVLAEILIYGFYENLLCYILARLLLIVVMFQAVNLVLHVKIPGFLQCSFPIYAMHTLILETFNKIFSFFLSPDSNWILVDYFGSAVLTIGSIVLVNGLLEKYLPRVHRFVFGGRNR